MRLPWIGEEEVCMPIDLATPLPLEGQLNSDRKIDSFDYVPARLNS